MARIKPITVPNRRVEPLRLGNGPYHIGDEDKFVRDLWAQEYGRIVGTDTDFFSLNLKKSKRDPLYDEPTERVWSKAYKIKAWVQKPDANPIVSESGFQVRFDATAWIARKEIEDVGAPPITEGDILRFWDLPFFNFEAAASSDKPKAGYYFDVIQVNTDGHINDTPTFVGFRVVIRRRSEFGAERKILPP